MFHCVLTSGMFLDNILFDLEEISAVCGPQVSNMKWRKIFASHVESGSEQPSIQVVAFQLSNDVKAALKEMFNYKVNFFQLDIYSKRYAV